jgi:hypothetical protein
VEFCAYNIYPTGSGEIISGRVTNRSGAPIAGAIVTAVQGGGAIHTAITNTLGIYALAKLPSEMDFTIKVAKPGFLFEPRSCKTGTSADVYTKSGNLWGADFTPASGKVATGVELLLLK